MGHGRTCLSVLAVSLLVSGTGLGANEAIAESPSEQFPPRLVALTTSHDLLATDPNALTRFLETARPAAVSTEEKARILSTLPLDGEVTDLSASARQKVAVLTELLRTTGYESVYQVKVIDVPQAGMVLHARAIILVSEAALTLLDADELQASLAHEMGHGCVWTERERAFQLGDHKRLKDLELVCDAIAIVTLRGLGMDVSRLMSGIEKISRFNRQRLGTANNERDYPILAERKAFARAMAATIR
jgi:predicted Zn-dependent protease